MGLRAGGRVERRQGERDVFLRHVARDADQAIRVIGIRPVRKAVRRMEHALHALHEGDAVLDLEQALDADEPRAELLAREARPRRPARPGYRRRRAEGVAADAGEVLAAADAALG